MAQYSVVPPFGMPPMFLDPCIRPPGMPFPPPQLILPGLPSGGFSYTNMLSHLANGPYMGGGVPHTTPHDVPSGGAPASALADSDGGQDSDGG